MKLIKRLLNKDLFESLIPEEVYNGADSYDLDKSKAYDLYRCKAKTIYGITVDGCLFYCNPYFGDGYNPYKDERREQLKAEVRNQFINTLKETI